LARSKWNLRAAPIHHLTPRIRPLRIPLATHLVQIALDVCAGFVLIAHLALDDRDVSVDT
jgi:hypothetical protein